MGRPRFDLIVEKRIAESGRWSRISQRYSTTTPPHRKREAMVGGPLEAMQLEVLRSLE